MRAPCPKALPPVKMVLTPAPTPVAQDLPLLNRKGSPLGDLM